ncbi:MAG TPA: PAS domain S-box protein [Candidatus Aerophobetes bacterium]|uniref:PAS domain S-box protein n=1 Tax=Aerophobetes bacterium TaxID=2030807 RepID=A0A7V0QRP2_UNCAE|nr:PAS domain S-box protein [Candidatus Aerophobetes bacterium]
MEFKFDHEFIKLLWESMADGVFTLDGNGRITSWNPAMEHITGYRAEEVMGRGCSFLNFNKCFGKSCPSGIEECEILRYKRMDSTECFLRHKDGHDVPVVKSARIVMDENGRLRGVVETITDLTELKEARKKVEDALSRLAELHCFDNIIGKSHVMQQVFSSIKAAAASDATVLIQGESGTGKELVAGAIHYNSHRSHMPFVTVNCSALSETLLESELFGHIRGAFTGAIKDRKGRFEEADGGTVFLDEVGEISPYIQVKLLRVLQEREIERVGESIKRRVDLRIIAATNRNLFELVRGGNFREDLYYRLKVFPIYLPPLRDRKEDIPLLVSHFIGEHNKKTGKRIKGLSHEAMRIMMDYEWPGNVRELQNAIEHAFVLCNSEYIDLFDLPLEIRQLAFRPIKKKTSISSTELLGKRRRLKKQELLELLKICNWNKAEVARRVGLSRTAIWKYMKKWNIPLRPPF